MKKQTKRVISGLVLMIMMLSVISPVSFAEHYDGIYVEVDALEDGKTANFFTSVEYGDFERYDVYDYNEDSYFGGVRIFDFTTGEYITPETIIDHEHNYRYEIVVEPMEGYGFSEYQGNPNVNGYIVIDTVNGDVNYNADVRWFGNGKEKIVLSCEYNARITEPIKYVSMNVNSPKQGEYPSYDYEILSDYIEPNLNFDDGEYCINGITWHHSGGYWDPLWLGEPMSEDEVFVGGETYRLTVRIAAKHDYPNDIEREFGFSYAPAAINDKVLLNGLDTRGRVDFPDEETNVYEEAYYIIFRDFYCPPKKTIKNVALEIDPPMLGCNPDFDVAFGGEGYKLIDNPPDDGFIRGIKWRDLTEGENLTEEDEFVTGHRYQFTVYLETKDDKTAFSVKSNGESTVTGTLNGVDAMIDSAAMLHVNEDYTDSKEIVFSYIFEAVSNEVTRVAVFDLDEPVAGEKPDYTATVKNEEIYSFNTERDDEYTLNGIYWENQTTGEKMSKDDLFEVGNQYSVDVYLTVNEDYAVGQEVSSSINSVATSYTFAIGGTGNLAIGYTFPEVEPLKTNENKAFGLTLPVEGGRPYYDVSLENDESYIKEIRWRDVSVSSIYGECLEDGDTFVGGHLYQIELDLLPGEYYEFMTDEEENPEFEFLFDIEGVECEGTVEGTKDEITVLYKFTPLPINRIDVSVDVPIPGVKPSFFAYAGNDACYVGEVLWYDKTDDVYITEDDVFEEGHVYVVYADVFTQDGRCFDFYSSEFAGTVNENAAEVGSVVYDNNDGNASLIYSTFYAIRLSYEFEPCVLETTLSVECDTHTGSVEVKHDIYSSFEENNIVAYIAFYNGTKLVSVVGKAVEWANDGYLEPAPEDATYCKAMLWNKNTMKPICPAADCEVIK